jgi:hypothetical protein
MNTAQHPAAGGLWLWGKSSMRIYAFLSIYVAASLASEKDVAQLPVLDVASYCRL